MALSAEFMDYARRAVTSICLAPKRTGRLRQFEFSIPTLMAFRRCEDRLMAGWRDCCPVFPAINLGLGQDRREIEDRYRKETAELRRARREWEFDNS